MSETRNLAAPNLIEHHRIYDDVDAMAADLIGHNVDVVQLDRGEFWGTMFQVGCPEALVTGVDVERMTEQRGSTPPGVRTFVVPAEDSMHMHWRSRDVRGDRLLSFPKSNELHAITRRDFSVYTISITEELLHAAAIRTGRERSLELALSNETHRPDEAALIEIRSMLRHLQRRVEMALPSSQEALQELLLQLLPERLLGSIGDADSGTEPAPRGRSRRALLQRAELYLREHLLNRPTVTGMCKHVGVGERTLQYAFRERYGMAPKAYMRVRRLAAVHRSLRAAAPSALVGELAEAHGFRHLSQFAADYRAQFGELPSTTLARR